MMAQFETIARAAAAGSLEQRGMLSRVRRLQQFFDAIAAAAAVNEDDASEMLMCAAFGSERASPAPHGSGPTCRALEAVRGVCDQFHGFVEARCWCLCVMQRFGDSVALCESVLPTRMGGNAVNPGARAATRVAVLATCDDSVCDVTGCVRARVRAQWTRRRGI